jgi:hypothetical protein
MTALIPVARHVGNGGDPNQIYKPLDGWHPGGARAQELAFWMNEPCRRMSRDD